MHTNYPAPSVVLRLSCTPQVKSAMRSLVYTARVNLDREEREEKIIAVPLNQLFVGPPGTGKTTVAKLYGEILRELGFLSNGEVICVGPSELMGAAVNASMQATAAMLEKAKARSLIWKRDNRL